MNMQLRPLALIFALAAMLSFAATASAAPPANDNFADAIEVFDGHESASTNVDATKESPDEHVAQNQSVWFSFTPLSNGELTVGACNANFDAGISVYRGSSLAGLNQLALTYDNCTADGAYSAQATVRVRKNEPIRIAVWGYSIHQGTFTFKVNLAAAPVNDDFAESTVLSGLNPNQSFTTQHASMETDEPRYGSSTGDRSVWFSWTAPLDGYARFDVCDAAVDGGSAGSWDTVMQVFTGSALAALTKRTFNDEGCPTGNGTRTVQFAVEAGETYHAQVMSYTNNVWGSATFNVEYESVPLNDNWADATDLGNAHTVAITDDNRFATNEPGEPPIYSNITTPFSVWYKWTAPFTGSVTIGTCSVATTADGIVSVFEAQNPAEPKIDELTRVATADGGCDSPAGGMGRLSMTVISGTTYWIGVGLYGAAAGTDFGLEITSAPRVTASPEISHDGLFVGDTLEATTGTWAGSPTITYATQWQRCTYDGTSCSAIDGATGSTYTLALEDDGFTVRFVVTASNSAGSANSASPRTDLIDTDTDADGIGDDIDECDDAAAGPGKTNGCPTEQISVVSSPTSSGDAVLGGVITLDDVGTAINNPDRDASVGQPTPSITWHACTSATEIDTCTQRSDADGESEYTITETDDASSDGNRYIRARVVWSNGEGTPVSAWSAATALVVDECPTLTQDNDKTNGCPLVPVEIDTAASFSGSPQAGQAIAVNPGAASNASGFGPAAAPTAEVYIWSVCDYSPTQDYTTCPGVGSPSATYTPTAADVGKVLVVRVIWANGENIADSLAVSAPVAAAPAGGGDNPQPPGPPAPPVTPSILDLAAVKLPSKATAKGVVKAKGKFTVKSVKFACPTGGAACKFSLSVTTKVKKKTVKMGTSTLTVQPGQTKPLSGKLSKGGLKLFKKSKKVKAAIAIKASGGAKGSKSIKSFTISR